MTMPSEEVVPNRKHRLLAVEVCESTKNLTQPHADHCIYFSVVKTSRTTHLLVSRSSRHSSLRHWDLLHSSLRHWALRHWALRH